MVNETLKMTAQERVCILSFGEMNVDSRICYDQVEDKVLDPPQQCAGSNGPRTFCKVEATSVF